MKRLDETDVDDLMVLLSGYQSGFVRTHELVNQIDRLCNLYFIDGKNEALRESNDRINRLLVR